MALRIPNRTARALWLNAQGLATAPTGPLDVLGTIERLGFVQLDTIQVVARAHHHILWSRNNNYREGMLNPLLARDRSIFEHFTHDASVIPMAFLPMWQRQFRRKKERMDAPGYFRNPPDAAMCSEIRARIAEEGALSTHAFDTKIEGPKEMWARPPHKIALDYMWYCGDLATCYRDGFTKFYNLPERVFPSDPNASHLSDDAQIDQLCRTALDRMSFGSAGDIQRFWDAMSAKEAKAWLDGAAPSLTPVEVETASGDWLAMVAPSDIEARIETLTTPTSRLRILNPFDPVVRDRARLERLFGFEYRNEMFVPAAKRLWGYYVFPILDGDRFVGRIELKADRKAGMLSIVNFWQEPRVKWPDSRMDKLFAELERMRRFVGVDAVDYSFFQR